MKRSKFSLSNYKLLTCNMGELIPCNVMEVLPGDTFQQASSAFVRFNPMVAPPMHPVRIQMHHWFVPYRLIWDDFEKFITGGEDGEGDGAVYPTIDWAADEPDEGELGDYLGIPSNPAGLVTSALPLRAYTLIYNEFYRDQDLIPDASKPVVSKASGPDTTTNVNLLIGAWEKDYFTSARPWPAKGPDITIPLAGSAPVISDGTAPTALWSNRAGARGFINDASNVVGLSGGTGAAGGTLDNWSNTGMEADLSNATDLASINELREAFALQRYQEARARYGSRYTEYLRYCGVRSSDARLQRPEYLGGGMQTIQFSEVLQTNGASATDVDGTGNIAGHGIGAMRSNRFRRFFEEHGIVISIVVVRPKTMYVQGLPRMWNRRTKEDFFQKELQYIGQQEILNKEIYGPGVTPDDVFGYQDRYDEYRRQESTIAGEMRSTTSPWHFARQFGSLPTLNQAFIECIPVKNPFQVQTGDAIQIMCNHSIQARRPVSANSRSFVL